MESTFREPSVQRQFDRDGFVIINDFLSLLSLRFLQDLHRDLDETFTTDFATSIMSRNLDYRARAHRGVQETIQDSVLRVVDGMNIVASGYVVKKAEAPLCALAMHQDWSFVDESRSESLGLWFPMTDVDRTHGCLFVIPGSHTLTRQPRGQTTPSQYRTVLSSLPEDALLDLPMRAGQALFFRHRIFHGSYPNVAASERVAAYAIMARPTAQLILYHQDAVRHPSQLEVLGVPRDFYVGYVAPNRPNDATHLGRVSYEPEPLTAASFQDAARVVK